jgi:cytochrome c
MKKGLIDPMIRFINLAAVVLLVTTFVPSSSAQASKGGARLFIQCKACHTLAKGEEHKLGPNLYGFLDRSAGTASDYTYSDALKNSGLRWRDDTLAEWLRNPHRLVPGNKMVFNGITDEAERAALIAYLKQATR